MSTNKATIARNYARGLWTDDMLKKLILKGKLSYEDYVEIVGSDIDVNALSAEETQKFFTTVVQNLMDTEATKLGYDNCNSVCTYVNTGVQKFDDEGNAFRAWRSAVWSKGYEILAEVKEGKRAIPTVEELLAELPKLVIEYTE